MTKRNENEPDDKASERLREFNRQRQPIPDANTQDENVQQTDDPMPDEKSEDELTNDDTHQSNHHAGLQPLIQPQQEDDDENLINDNPFKNDVP